MALSKSLFRYKQASLRQKAHAALAMLEEPCFRAPSRECPSSTTSLTGGEQKYMNHKRLRVFTNTFFFFGQRGGDFLITGLPSMG